MNAAAATIFALVGDYAAVNLTTFKSLGAELPEKPSFYVKSQPEKVHVFLDNCHLMKLV